MAVISTTYSRFRERFSLGSRAFGDFATGAGLWLLIVAFCSWAFIGERDAFVVGLVSGSVFALGAIGITLIYGVLKFGHFAHGDSMMFAAYVAFLLLTGTMLGDNSDVTALPVSLGDSARRKPPHLELLVRLRAACGHGLDGGAHGRTVHPA